LKREGESVSKGEMLLEIETDKAVVEIEAQSDGILAGVIAKVGDVIPVGQTIAWLLRPGESVPAPTTAPAQSGRKMDSAAAAPASAAPASSAPGGDGRARMSPRARRLMKENGIDPATVRGTGPGGEILAEDVLKLLDTGSPATPDAPSTAPTSESVSSIGRLMAERTAQSWTTVPHFFVTRTVDATALNQARTQALPAVERSHGVKVTHTDLLVAAVARALVKHPRMNGRWDDGRIALHADVNVALAMAVDNAVVTAVLKNAAGSSLGDLAQQRMRLTERARANRLQPEDIGGATFTISNLGMFGVDAFTAIIVPPQAGILAVGAIADRVVAIDGEIAVRPTMTLTLSSDHRVVDGARAAAFLNDVVEALQAPPEQWMA
jgi:pyruvate dehydrogenase E2 component (dihydrolipoamide acetyltransferase)